VVDLEGASLWRLRFKPESFVGVWIGFIKALGVERRFFAVDVMLDKVASQMQGCLMKLLVQPSSPSDATIAPGRRQRRLKEKQYLAARDSSPEPSVKSGPPFDSPHLPRAGGGRRK
jgi:hypothetical protein